MFHFLDDGSVIIEVISDYFIISPSGKRYDILKANNGKEFICKNGNEYWQVKYLIGWTIYQKDNKLIER